MKEQAFRNPIGGMIDRTRALTFRFNGRRYVGFAGDTLASALLANGVRVVGRSFKYHRPRGIFGAGAEEPNALVQIGEGARTLPNSKATEIELYDGLVARSQNCWPSVEFDVGAAAGLFAPMLPAGFYYKTFKWPAAFWERLYEPLIRRAAGIGRAPVEPDPDRYDHRTAHCDVLVVGAGPAGLSAAAAAAENGARVTVVDDGPVIGGSLLRLKGDIGGQPFAAWISAMQDRLAAATSRILTRATAFGYYDHNQVALIERVTDHRPARPGEPRQRLWHVRAREVVLATGAHERSMLFDDNDRPGVMLASAAQGYVNRFAVRPGATAVVFTNNDSAYAVALDLADGGIRVAALVDTRRDVSASLTVRLDRAQIKHLPGTAVLATRGSRRLNGVIVGVLAAAGPAETQRIDCDLLCVSGGFSPALHLHAQSGGKPTFDPALGVFVPGTSVQAERSAGAAAGTFAIEACVTEGEAAGRDAALAARAVAAGAKRSVRTPVAAVCAGPTGGVVLTVPRFGARSKRFVDLQEDVCDSDIALAVREGYRSVEHVKRYTTLGMGTDQGKTSNTLGFATIAAALGGDMAEGGTTTFRPPYVPVTLGALAGAHGGRHFQPVRRTPMHDRHVAAGAAITQSGSWLRPQCYPRRGESLDEASRREARVVRNGVGLVDVSTLGKIELFGGDATEFLERVYVNRWRSLPVGRSRYGVMLRDDGMVFDDGTVSRLGENHYFLTTTTAQAALVRRRLEHCAQVLWPKLDIVLVVLTDQWAAMALAGPHSRDVLARLMPEQTVGDAALPHMGWGAGLIGDISVRLSRVSFSGERAYEIFVPASRGAAAWDLVLKAGVEFDIAPYGVDAMNALRIDKGHVTGAEINGRTTPNDLGLTRMLKRDGDFIGRRSLARPGLAYSGRWQLVGLAAEDGATPLPQGGKIVADPRRTPPNPILGEITSTAWSPSLDAPIGLALLADGRSRHGELVYAVSPLFDQEVAVRVRPPVFFDPKGEKLRG